MPAENKHIIKLGRAILAITGLRRLLTPGGLKITPEDFKAATKLEADIIDTVERFLDGKTETTPLPKYDHKDVSELLFRTLDEESFAEKLSRFRGHPGGDDYVAAADRAIAFLRTRTPRKFRQTFTGPVEVDASKVELIAWRWVLETVGHPLWAVKQLLSATLNQSNVEALQLCWPDVLQVAQEAARAGIVERMGASKKPLNFTRRQIRQLAVLTGNDPTHTPDVVAALQEAFSVQPPGPKKPPVSSDSDDDPMMTTLQKTANR